MKRRIAALICLLLSLLLMVPPFGVAMRFAPGPDERITELYSYFSGMPLGYGNAFPLLAVLCAAAAAVLVSFRPDGRMRLAALLCTGAAALATAASWLQFGSFTVAGLAILLLQATALGLLLSRP